MSKEQNITLEFEEKKCSLHLINPQEYSKYRKDSIPIQEEVMEGIYTRDLIKSILPNIQYPHYYMALKGLFGESDDFYDDYKCSFGYLFLVKIEESHYTLNLTDNKGCFSFYFRKLLTTPNDFEEYGEIPRDIIHEPFDDFSKEDIKRFIELFFGYLLSYIFAHEESYNEEFIRYQNYDSFIYGYRDGAFFVDEYGNSEEEQNRFYKEKRKLEALESKNDFIEKMTKNPKVRTKDFKFDREESNQRESKWGAFADRMSGLTTPEITNHIQKTSQELRGGVEKKLPKGFTEPIEVDNYDSIALKEEIHKG